MEAEAEGEGEGEGRAFNISREGEGGGREYPSCLCSPIRTDRGTYLATKKADGMFPLAMGLLLQEVLVTKSYFHSQRPRAEKRVGEQVLQNKNVPGTFKARCANVCTALRCELAGKYTHKQSSPRFET